MKILFLLKIFFYLSLIFVSFNREKLQLALAARDRAEKKQQEYEDKLKSMQEEMERSQVNIYFNRYFLLFMI